MTVPAAAGTLHYIFDPLCGWCYAAAPLVEAARQVPGLQVVFHAGGMMTGANRRSITPQWRAYVMPHDHRIAQLSGQPFGEAYFDGLLNDTGAVLDSEPPITAVLAAQAVAGRGLDMVHRLQQAHYVEGRRIADADVLRAVASQLGLDAQAFADAIVHLSGDATSRHIADSRRLLATVGRSGFPTFAWESTDGRHVDIDVGNWLGRTAEWCAHLTSLR
ncbi:DsbA family protein [Variovorax ginsengisoli]|uniref:DSBA-like thioredoxin domain-containing protein n=1 Tax=Variovorax ginsengisoli TaxID=363844 RepID=A0ABT9SER2_9BURK|nr:DsbA family protein [Variovorax ginsengisoli]MDP9901862.1 putative protein-disulfide isomerase [Variovorax ginsengisoli]